MKFLIDECLSLELATEALRRGFLESVHVTRLGLGSREDWGIVRREGILQRCKNSIIVFF